MKASTSQKVILSLTSLLMLKIFFDINIPRKLPFIEVELPNDNILLFIFICIIVYSSIFYFSSWKEASESEIPKLELLTVIFFLLGASISLAYLYTKKQEISWINIPTSLLILLLGFVPMTMGNFIITGLFTKRSKQEQRSRGLKKYPPATIALFRTIYIFLLPVTTITVLCIILLKSYIPTPTAQYSLFIFITPLVVGNFLGIKNSIIYLIGPSKDKEKALKKLTMFKTAFDYHEMLYQHGGISPYKDFELNLLSRYVCIGDYNTVKEMLEHGEDPNQENARGWTPLMFAAAENKLDILNLLLEHGADPNLENYLGRRALGYAINYGFIDIIESLLINEADVNNSNEHHGSKPSILAARNGNIDIMKLLIEFGAKLNVKDDDGNTPLKIAMKNGNGDLAKLIRNQLKNEAVDETDEIDNSNETNLNEWVKKKINDDK